MSNHNHQDTASVTTGVNDASEGMSYLDGGIRNLIRV